VGTDLNNLDDLQANNCTTLLHLQSSLLCVLLQQDQDYVADSAAGWADIIFCPTIPHATLLSISLPDKVTIIRQLFAIKISAKYLVDCLSCPAR
jgi:hypothetical protein